MSQIMGHTELSTLALGGRHTHPEGRADLLGALSLSFYLQNVKQSRIPREPPWKQK